VELPDTHPQAIASAYVAGVVRLLEAIDLEAVLRVYRHLAAVRLTGRMIYLAGNGGSAATASHWGNDLGKAARRADAPPIRVRSLVDHVPWLTALANDEGYARVFAGQLEALVEPGDVLVVFSASGNSPNLVEAVRTAAARGATTIAFLGFDGGVLKTMVDDCVWLPTARGAYGQVEDGHHILCHLLTQCLAGAAIGAPAEILTRVHSTLPVL
jgi:D-sedoheptulose 7-phosphate isomerase